MSVEHDYNNIVIQMWWGESFKPIQSTNQYSVITWHGAELGCLNYAIIIIYLYFMLKEIVSVSLRS